MRLRQPLNDILGRRSKVILLRYLVLSRRETTGRDLARSTGLDHKTCLQTLKDLDRSDVVRGRRIGNAWVYRLNDEFPIVREVLEPAFKWEHALLNRLARDLRKRLGRDAISIFLFGSVAKGTEQPESDIDLLIVARDRTSLRGLDQRMDSASDWIIQKYSRVPQFMFMEARQFADKFARGDRFVSDIVRTGFPLDGLRLHEILGLVRTTHAPTKRRQRRLTPSSEGM